MAKFCEKCGTELKKNDTFCSNCGNPIDESAKVVNTTTTTSGWTSWNILRMFWCS